MLSKYVYPLAGRLKFSAYISENVKFPIKITWMLLQRKVFKMWKDGSKLICINEMKCLHLHKECLPAVWNRAAFNSTQLQTGAFSSQAHGEDVRKTASDPGSHGGAGSGAGPGRGSERCLGACWRPFYRLSAGPHRCHKGTVCHNAFHVHLRFIRANNRSYP